MKLSGHDVPNPHGDDHGDEGEAGDDMMNQDLYGLVENCCRAMGTNDRSGYGFSLRTLVKNLRQLRDRHARGDAQVVYEFFDLYLVDEPTDGRAIAAEILGERA